MFFYEELNKMNYLLIIFFIGSVITEIIKKLHITITIFMRNFDKIIKKN